MSYGSIMGQSQDTSKIEQDIVNLQNDYVPKSGATMTGELNMGNNKISGVANGVEANDVATVGQLDSAGWYPFKGSDLTLIRHDVGYIDSSNYDKTFHFNEDISSVYVYVCVCIDSSRSSASTCGGRVRFNYDMPIYDGASEVGRVSKPSSIQDSIELSLNDSGYYDIYIYK